MARERRLVFGEVAELYDRHRPAYPQQLVDDVLDLGNPDGHQAVLEVGAGTGKATAMFAARGIPVLALEPSSEMAAVARRNGAAYPSVEIEESDFENWDPAGREFPLLFSAQAWHWVEGEVAYVRARSALTPGGVLAVFWNRPRWERSEIRETLLAAYEEAAPELSPGGPMHPANLFPDADEDWEAEIAATDGIGRAEVRSYKWSQDYSPEEYVGLLATISDIRLLNEDRQRALITAVRSAIEAHGSALTLPWATRLCLGRAD